MAHFFTTIGVDGLKLTSIKHLNANGYTTIASLIEAKATDLEKIERIGTSKARGWTSQIKEKLKQLDWVTVADASAVFPSFGKDRLEKIYEAYPDIMRYATKRNSVVSKVQSIAGFKELAYEFAEKLLELKAFIQEHGFRIKKPKKVEQSGSKMQGQLITMTGVRDKQINDFVLSNGGKIQNMKKDTTILLIKDESYHSSKVDKAEKDGIPVLTIEQFKKRFKI